MFRMIRFGLFAALLLLLCGCDHGGSGTTTTLSLSIADDVIPTKTADDECFAAVPGVTVLGHAADGRPSACRAVAARYFGERRRFAWPPPLIESGDHTTECFMRRGSERLVVVRKDDPEADDAIALAEKICAGLRERGWRRIPLAP
jgi:hypothetical protein